jgi:hypothetical protein
MFEPLCILISSISKQFTPFSFTKFAASPNWAFKENDYELTAGFGLRISGKSNDHDFFVSEIKIVVDSN